MDPKTPAAFARRKKQLKDKPALEVEYESLTANWDPEFLRIQHFLKIPPQSIPLAKYKQEKRPLEDVVLNYEEARSIAEEMR